MKKSCKTQNAVRDQTLYLLYLVKVKEIATLRRRGGMEEVKELSEGEEEMQVKL